MDINTQVNQLITTIQKSLKERLDERNKYIHNLQWEHHKQLEKYKEENKQLKNENENLNEQLNEFYEIFQVETYDELNDKIYNLKKEINELKMLLGQPFIPLTAEQQVRREHGLQNYA